MSTVLWSLLFVVLALVVLALVAFIAPYNALIRQRNVIQESWGQVDEELERRHVVAGALLDAVRGRLDGGQRAAEVEASRIEAVRLAGDEASELADPSRVAAEKRLGRALRALVSEAEAVPSLATDDRFVAARHQFLGTEDRIAAGRRFYDANVRTYDNRLATRPGSVVARLFGFAPAPDSNGEYR